VVAAPEALLVEPRVAQTLRGAPLKPTGHGAAHDPINLIPRQSRKILGLHLAAHRLKDADRVDLEQLGEAAALLSPNDAHLLDPTLRTVHSRHLSRNERLPLHRVQMPPTPGTTVVARRLAPALRTA
jgi:hypothetical protein